MESAEGLHKRREMRIAEEQKTKMPRETAVGVFHEFGFRHEKKRIKEGSRALKFAAVDISVLFFEIYITIYDILTPK